MDKLAKRAGVAMLVVVATTGSAFALGLIRFAVSEPRPDSKASQAAAAAPQRLAAPPTPIVAAVQPPKPAELPLTISAAAPLAERTAVVAKAAKPAKKATLPQASPPTDDVVGPASEAADSDLIDFGSAADDREAKLADREARAFAVRQPGGPEAQHKPDRAGVRVTFETDLASPEPH